MDSLGKRVRALREQKGWSQRELGDHMGLTQGAISQWESDDKKPTVPTLFQLADLFGVSVDDLVRGTTHSPAEKVAQ